MRRSPLTPIARGYFLLGALLSGGFLLTLGPHLAQQVTYVWMAFGVGIALMAYGRSHVRHRCVSRLCTWVGAAWIAFLVFVIFGVPTI